MSPADRSEAETVGCALPSGAEEATEAVLRDLPWQALPTTHLEVVDGVVQVPLPAHRGRTRRFTVASDGQRRTVGTFDGNETAEVKVTLPGVGTTRARIVPGKPWRCEVDPVVRHVVVTGRVRATRAIDDRVRVVGCGGDSGVDRDGGFHLEVEPGRCTLRAVWEDGAFGGRSAPVAVDPTSGDEVVLDLDLPGSRTAGVGVTVHEHELGVEIRGTYPGSPADRAGLDAGDLVVAVDGVDTVDLDLESFRDLSLGPAGEEVVYTVLRGGEKVDVVMVREEMERITR